MNRRPITYNYLKTIANGSIHFHAFSYQYPGSGYQAVEKSNLPHGFLFFTAPQLIGLLVDKLKRFVVGIGSIFA